ncbi:MAG: tRNA (guanine(10)-N(2))-dimethyltransferase [Nitrososphaeraceae archaeon]
MHDNNFTTVIEGNAKLLVPKLSLTNKVPPHNPAFFNPLAKLNRDISILIYNAFLSNIDRSEISFADVLASIGARGIRVGIEVPKITSVYINDINRLAISKAKESVNINSSNYFKYIFTNNDAYTFLSNRPTPNSKKFFIVDLDPFGSPSKYIDCVLRSTENNGLISITATDTTVLCGIYPNVCLRKYYGRSINNSYSNEIAIRLLLSVVSIIAARFDLSICPIFVHSNKHYFRIYFQIKKNKTLANKLFEYLGYLRHCFKCHNREIISEYSSDSCNFCNNRFSVAGKIWLGSLYDKKILRKILNSNSSLLTNSLIKLFNTAIDEHDEIPYYFTLDEISSILKTSPKKLDQLLSILHNHGYRGSKTAFDYTGFKTNANISQVASIMRS